MDNITVSVASASETVEVTTQAVQMQTDKAYAYSADGTVHSGPINGVITEREVSNLGLNGRNFSQLVPMAPGVSNPNIASANVMNLQRRVAGVLPVAIDVPRAGTSFSFVRPLVLDEETKVTFSY